MTQNGSTFFLLNQTGEIMNNPEALHSSGLEGLGFCKDLNLMAALCTVDYSSGYTEVTVKEGENECRILCWIKVQVEISLHGPVGKQVNDLPAYKGTFWCDKQQRKHLKLTFFSLSQNHEAWITQTNFGAVF